jgi:hypothetical protein
MAPSLEPAVVVVHAPSRLPAARTDPSTATQADRHDHPLAAEAHIDDRGAGQAQQPVECRRDAHVVLLAGRLTLNSQRPALEDGGASPPAAQPPNTSPDAQTSGRASTSRTSTRYFTTEWRGDPHLPRFYTGYQRDRSAQPPAQESDQDEGVPPKLLLVGGRVVGGCVEVGHDVGADGRRERDPGAVVARAGGA